MATCVWMFSSPGAHLVGALGSLVDGKAEYRVLLRDVDDICGAFGWGPVSPLLLIDKGTGERPEHLWLGFYATSVVLARILVDAGVRADVCLGHSGGEVTALVAAGALSVPDGARLLCERMKAVGEADAPPGAMLAVNAHVRRVREMCGAVGDRSLAVAVDNGPRQVVVSGRAEAIDLLRRLAEVIGVPATLLGIPGAYHNPMFAWAADRFAQATADIPLRQPTTPVYSAQLGRYVRTRTDIRELLDGLLVLPVGFREALMNLYDEGAETFIECGARTVLSDLVTAALPAEARAMSLLPDRAAALQVGERVASLLPHVPAADLDSRGIRLNVVPSPTAAAAPVPAAGPAARPPLPKPRAEATAGLAVLPTWDELVARIRQVYADVLQYPIEVIEEDAELEADLGVSSLKHTQAFVKLLDLFRLPTPGAEIRLFSYRTVGQIAGLLEQLAGQESSHAAV
jgi:[acyl-carrier-protein] S-malonyltransferase